MPPLSRYETRLVRRVVLRTAYRRRSWKGRIRFYRSICSRSRLGYPLSSIATIARTDRAHSPFPNQRAKLTRAPPHPRSRYWRSTKPRLTRIWSWLTRYNCCWSKRRCWRLLCRRQRPRGRSNFEGEIDRIVANAEREQAHGKDVNITFILVASLVSIGAMVLVGSMHCCCTRLEDPMLVFRGRLDSNSTEAQSVHGKLLAVLGFRVTIIQGNKA